MALAVLGALVAGWGPQFSDGSDERVRPAADGEDDDGTTALDRRDGDAAEPAATLTPGEDDGPAGDDAPEAPDGAEEGADTRTPDDGTDREERDAERTSVIAWLLRLGPGAPEGPSAFRAYEMLRELECQRLLNAIEDEEVALEDATPLYRGAATACLAALHARPELWEDARRAHAEVRDFRGSCLDELTLRVLEDLLTAHERDPDARIVAGTGAGQAEAPPCPTIRALEPDRGPPGTPVRVVGDHLDGVTEVWLVFDDGEPARLAPEVVNGDLLVPLDAPVDEGEVCVTLRADPEWNADGARFVVEGAERDAEGPGTEPEGREDDEAEDQVDPGDATEQGEPTDREDRDAEGPEADGREDDGGLPTHDGELDGDDGGRPEDGDGDGDADAAGASVVLTGAAQIRVGAPPSCPPGG